MMVPEAELEKTDAGLVPASVGWFVMNARDARWFHRPGRDGLPLTGHDEFEAETYFPMLGMSIQVLSPGEPNSMYHWETEQEDFLVLSGEALLIVEGQERPLKHWDFVHCPPETRHVFVGAGDEPCVILAASSRQFQKDGPWGYYTVDEIARRYNACPDEETQDADVAYARVPPAQATRYRDGLLPDFRCGGDEVPSMNMRRLKREEVELFWTIDRSEVHHYVYEVHEGQLVRVPKYYEITGWRADAVEKETAALFDCFDRGGTFLGLFDADVLVGIGVLESVRVGPASDQMQLASLYVSRSYRGRGVGTQLFDAAVSIAREAGANALYVSATPTENTVDFYLGRGCVLAPEPDPRLLAAEPDDVHLILPM